MAKGVKALPARNWERTNQTPTKIIDFTDKRFQEVRMVRYATLLEMEFQKDMSLLYRRCIERAIATHYNEKYERIQVPVTVSPIIYPIR